MNLKFHFLWWQLDPSRMSTLDCVISYRRCAGMLLMSSWCFQVLTAGITTQFYIYLVFRNSFQNVNLISNLFIYLKITWCDILVAMHPSTKVGTTGTLLLARLLDFWLQSNCRLKLHKLKVRLYILTANFYLNSKKIVIRPDNDWPGMAQHLLGTTTAW